MNTRNITMLYEVYHIFSLEYNSNILFKFNVFLLL